MAKRSATARLAGLALGAAAAAVAVWAVKDIPAQMGAVPDTGERGARVRRSPQFRDGKFRNSVPSSTMPGEPVKVFRELLRRQPDRHPTGPIPIVTGISGPAPSTGLHLTWYGHATTLIEIEGRTVLLDPVWSERVSPSQLAGPKRLHPVPIGLADLPEIDAVVISHDHYDHLDMDTIVYLATHHSAPFLVPLGVGAHLERWGIPTERIIELDWHEDAVVAGIRFTVTPARHFSGRGLSRDHTLWGSWVIAGPKRRVFYSGDTGYFDGFAEIGEKYGPFDATLVQIGAYGEGWPDIHMVPEDGLRTHLDVRGGLMIPVHWCTFVLAFHAWSEPVERLCRDAKEHGVTLAVPRPGERVDVDNPPELDAWWQTISAPKALTP
jgi:L-ascorbate metabolism protein UlaG (beta-lactamase superfamily)